jgi:hypothetical protein
MHLINFTCKTEQELQAPSKVGLDLSSATSTLSTSSSSHLDAYLSLNTVRSGRKTEQSAQSTSSETTDEAFSESISSLAWNESDFPKREPDSQHIGGSPRRATTCNPLSQQYHNPYRKKTNRVQNLFITLIRVHFFDTCWVQVQQDWIKQKEIV